MTAPVIRCYTTADTAGGTATSLAINKPTSSSSGSDPKNAEVGDLLVILASNDDTTDVSQFGTGYGVSGWTRIGAGGGAANDCHWGAWYKVVDGTEGSSFTITAESADDMAAVCLLISGADTSNPINDVGYGAAATAADSTTPMSMQGPTTTVADCLVMAWAAYDGGDDGGFTWAGTGWSEFIEVRSGTGSANVSATLATNAYASTGNVPTATVYPASADGMYGYTWAIGPGTQTAITPGTGSLTLSGNAPGFFRSDAPAKLYLNYYNSAPMDGVGMGQSRVLQNGRGTPDSWYSHIHSAWTCLELSPQSYSIEDYTTLVSGGTAEYEFDGYLPSTDPGNSNRMFSSMPIAAQVTISGTISGRFYCYGDTTAKIGAYLFKRSGRSGAFTKIGEMWSSSGVPSGYGYRDMTGTASSTNMYQGDRIFMVPMLTNNGTMGTGTVYLRWGGASGYESYIQFEQAIQFMSYAAGTKLFLTDATADISTPDLDLRLARIRGG